mgnify:CR=1 FL=1
MPPGSYPPPPPLPYPDAPRRRPRPEPARRRWPAVLAGAVLAVLGASALLAWWLAGRDEVPVTEVAVGDCVRDVPDRDRVAALAPVACTEPHRGEVFAVLTLDGPAERPAPEEFDRRCRPVLAQYAPAAAADPAVELFVLYPAERAWRAGEHTVTCIATTPHDRTGSLRG